MHLVLHPEVRLALQMMSFLKYNRLAVYFHRRFSAFLIALMKLAAGIYVEIVLLTLISKHASIENIIRDFVILGFIIELDNFTARNIDTARVDEKIE